MERAVGLVSHSSGTRAAPLPRMGASRDSSQALVSPPPSPYSLVYATAAGAGHDYAGHAECAARVPAIMDALERSRVTSLPGVLELTGFSAAPLDLILPVHHPRYLKALEQISAGADDGVGVVVELELMWGALGAAAGTSGARSRCPSRATSWTRRATSSEGTHPLPPWPCSR
jgi:acetoin utilization deacetylase AcuC-like enzyme